MDNLPSSYLLLSKVAAAANEVEKISFLSRSLLYLDLGIWRLHVKQEPIDGNGIQIAPFKAGLKSICYILIGKETVDDFVI